MVKRIIDLTLSLLVGILLLPVACIIALIVRLESNGPALFWSDRVGKNNEIYKMPKFRTMKVGTPAVATNELRNPASYITKFGVFLRKTSLDEVPQLWSVLKGDMSLVGPRPALFNQENLIQLRTQNGIHEIKPGITGWAQVNGRDTNSTERKVSLDKYYLIHKNALFDLKILCLTIFVVLKRTSVTH